MATIVERKRKDGTLSYVAQIIKRSLGHQESKTFDTRRKAEAWAKMREREIAAAVEQGRPVVSQKSAGKTLGDAIDLYLTESQKSIGRTKTQILNTIRNEYDIANKRCENIISHDLVKFAKEIFNRPTVKSPATVLTYMASLSTIFANARALWGLPLSKAEFDEAMISCRHMGYVAKPRKKDRRPTVDEMNTLGHVDKWRTQKRIDVISMKPRKLSAVLS